MTAEFYSMETFRPLRSEARSLVSILLISSLRAIKTPEEIECIRKAGDVTIEALKQMLKSARPGEYEYQWAADYEHYVARWSPWWDCPDAFCPLPAPWPPGRW